MDNLKSKCPNVELRHCNFQYCAIPATREVIRKGSLKQLKDQAAGLMTSIAALEDSSSLEETATNLVKYGELKMDKKNTSFLNEKEKRRNMYI